MLKARRRLLADLGPQRWRRHQDQRGKPISLDFRPRAAITFLRLEEQQVALRAKEAAQGRRSAVRTRQEGRQEREQKEELREADRGTPLIARRRSSRFGELKPSENRSKNRFNRRLSNGEIG